jgi:hypothetical protein
MFVGIRNTGDDHWGASSGVPPSQSNLSCDNSHINLDDEEEADNDDDSEPEQVTPTSLRLRGKRAAGPIYNKGKKPKTNTGHWLKEHMHLLDNPDLCMTLVCSFMHLGMTTTNSHTPLKVCLCNILEIIKFIFVEVSCNSILLYCMQENIIMLTPDIQIDLDTWHHIRVRGTMCRIGGEVLLQVGNKKC